MNREKTRTFLSFLNVFSGVLNRVLVAGIKLASKIVFLRYLSEELYGVSGLFSNVLGLLALAELGLGTAITFSLYRPLAEKDEEKTAVLMAFYRRAYRTISLVILLLGLALMPFLPYFINGETGIDHLWLIYLLFLANMVIEYLFSYKRTIATASQEAYRLAPFTTGFEFAVAAAQIAVIVAFHAAPWCYFLYLSVQTVLIFVENLVINRYLDRKYPVLKKIPAHAALPDAEKKTIFTNVRALIFHKIGGVVVAGTDNLLISKLIDLVTVGHYLNYSSLITTVSGVVYLFVGNTTASFGNLIVTETPDRRRETFHELLLFYSALYSVGTACFFNLFTPFITLAYGERFLLPRAVVILVVTANFYLLGQTYVLDVVKSAAGLYDRDKWVPLAQAALNLGVSIWLGKTIGLAGIFIGTLVSTLLPLIAKPVIVYRQVFDASPAVYFGKFFYEAAVAAALCAGSAGLCRLFPDALSLPARLAVNLFVSVIAGGGLFLLCHLKSRYLPALFRRFGSLLKKGGGA